MKKLILVISLALVGWGASPALANQVIGFRPVGTGCGISTCGVTQVRVGVIVGVGTHGYSNPTYGYPNYGYGFGYMRPRCATGGCFKRCGRCRRSFSLAIGVGGFSFGLRIF